MKKLESYREMLYEEGVPEKLKGERRRRARSAGGLTGHAATRLSNDPAARPRVVEPAHAGRDVRSHFRTPLTP
jgi:hypothetical protein